MNESYEDKERRDFFAVIYTINSRNIQTNNTDKKRKKKMK